MPSSTTVEHNNVKMTFTEHDHSYVDSTGRKYTSVTTLVGMGFEKFDAEAVAKMKAARDGGDWKELTKKWARIGESASNFGTRLHENCEYQILGEENRMHNPIDVKEKINFELAYEAVKRLKEDAFAIKFEPEKLIFSPKLGISGSIDLLITYKDGNYGIFDWKNIKGISTTGFNGKHGILEATRNIPDSNYWHYALQLQMYEIILKVEGYIPKDASVTRTLNCFINNRLEIVELPDVKENAKMLIKWLNRK